jgi:hypothetical protein
MNAEEARKTALDFNTNETNSQFQILMTDIEKRSKKGEYELQVYDTIKKDVVDKLLKLGFVVDKPRSGGPNESITQISWK